MTFLHFNFATFILVNHLIPSSIAAPVLSQVKSLYLVGHMLNVI